MGIMKLEDLVELAKDDRKNLFPIYVKIQETAAIHAFGFQELGRLNARNIFGQDGDQAKQQALLNRLDRVLGNDYKRLESIGMVGLFLVVYVHHSKFDTAGQFIGEFEGDRVKRGPLGLLGNKGAVCLRLTLEDKR